MAELTWTDVRRTVRQDRVRLLVNGIAGWEAWERLSPVAFQILAAEKLDETKYAEYQEMVRSELEQIRGSDLPDW